jgi:anti-anti-sigma factor
MVLELVDNDCRIVRAIGSIDLSNVGEFDAALDRAVTASPRGFVIDLSDATYLDSAGIKAILAAYQRVSQAGGKLSTVTGSKNIRDLFDLIQLSAMPGLFV